jgi:hypothetical protein
MRLTNQRLFKLSSALGIGVTLIVGVLIFFNLNAAAINNELVALDLVPKPEKLTELYFNNSANLPASATGDQAISFSFVIHNLEAANYQYVYEVSVNANGTRRIVDSGKVLVKNNQYYVKNEQFNLLSSPGRQEVVVALTNMQQSIDFWIETR